MSHPPVGLLRHCVCIRVVRVLRKSARHARSAHPPRLDDARLARLARSWRTLLRTLSPARPPARPLHQIFLSSLSLPPSLSLPLSPSPPPLSLSLSLPPPISILSSFFSSPSSFSPIFQVARRRREQRRGTESREKREGERVLRRKKPLPQIVPCTLLSYSRSTPTLEL